MNVLKRSIQQKNNEIRSYINNFKDFVTKLESDAKGQYIFEMNERKRELSLRYKANCKFKECFQDFLNFMVKKIQEQESTSVTSTDKIVEIDESSTKLMKKIDEDEK